MLNFLIGLGVVAVLVSAGLTLFACIAAARSTEVEHWTEEPLVMPEISAPIPQTKRA